MNGMQIMVCRNRCVQCCFSADGWRQVEHQVWQLEGRVSYEDNSFSSLSVILGLEQILSDTKVLLTAHAVLKAFPLEGQK